MTDGERNDGVLNMVTNTRALLRMERNIRGALRMQFAITTVSKPFLGLVSVLVECFDSNLLVIIVRFIFSLVDGFVWRLMEHLMHG